MHFSQLEQKLPNNNPWHTEYCYQLYPHISCNSSVVSRDAFFRQNKLAVNGLLFCRLCFVIRVRFFARCVQNSSIIFIGHINPRYIIFIFEGGEDFFRVPLPVARCMPEHHSPSCYDNVRVRASHQLLCRHKRKWCFQARSGAAAFRTEVSAC